MMKDGDIHIAICDWCIHLKRQPEKLAMEYIQAMHPLELVDLDYLTIEVTEGGKDVHMLVITDHFTQ